MPQFIHQVRNAVSSALGDAVRLVMVFGSCANGQAKPDSDLDIAVDAGRLMSPIEQFSLISALAASTGRPIDLVDLRTAGEPLLGQILRHGQRVQGSEEVFAQYLTQHLMNVADFVPLQQRIFKERRQAWIEQ